MKRWVCILFSGTYYFCRGKQLTSTKVWTRWQSYVRDPLISLRREFTCVNWTELELLGKRLPWTGLRNWNFVIYWWINKYWLVGWLVGLFFDCFFACFVGCLVVLLVGWLVGWFFDSVVYMTDTLVLKNKHVNQKCSWIVTLNSKVKNKSWT